MLPLRDENPHPPGFKPKLTIALIIMNVIVFGIEVAITGQFIEFSNYEAMNMFLTVSYTHLTLPTIVLV